MSGFGYIVGNQAEFVEFPETRTRPFGYGIRAIIDSTLKCTSPPRTRTISYELPDSGDDYLPAVGDGAQPRKKGMPIWEVIENLDGERQKIEFYLSHQRDEKLHCLAEVSELARNPNAPLAERQWAAQAINEVARHLVAVVAVFSRQKVTLGLVDPGNVHFYARGGQRNGAQGVGEIVLVLPDLFLTPVDPATPLWVQMRGPYAFIWNSETTQSGAQGWMSYLLQQTDRTTYDPAAERRCLARMLAWVLTGKEMTSIPKDLELKGAIWDLLRRILTKEHDDVSAADIDVLGNGMDTHLEGGEKIPERTPPKGSVVPALALTGLLAACLAGFWAFRGTLFPPVPVAQPPVVYPFCKDCPDSKLHASLVEKQLPLHQAIRKHYLSPGDTAVPGEPLPTLNRFDPDKKLLTELSENLHHQLDNLEALIREASDEIPDDLKCVKQDALRLQTELITHVRVLHPILIPENRLGNDDGKEFSAKASAALHRLHELLGNPRLNMPPDEKLVEQLKSDNSGLEEAVLKKHVGAAARLNDPELAYAFLQMCRTYEID